MALTRRDFLRLTGGATAIAACPSLVLQGCRKQVAKALETTPVIWLQAQSCSGCSVSLINGTNPDFATLITQNISLNFHQTACGGTGEALMSVIEKAVQKQRKDYVLILEGSVPEKAAAYCTLGEKEGAPKPILEWVRELGANAKALVAVGSCATFGGIPAASPRDTKENPTGAVPLAKLFPDKKVVNISGCPAHPDWIMGTLLHLLLSGMPELDQYNRPKMFFGTTVHEACVRLPDFEADRFAQKWGESGCLYQLGCLGPDAGCDIPKRKWLGVNSCTECGSGCIGCTEPFFPDAGERGLYEHRRAQLDNLKNARRIAHV